MDRISDKVRLRGVQIKASASFTADMAENLVSVFRQLDEGEQVTVNLSNKGVWAVTPQGIRLFLGSTEVFSASECDANEKIQ